MKNCPKCNSEVEDNFELCWNCNFSFTENKVIDIAEFTKGSREIACIRCAVHLIYSGNFKFHEGAQIGVFGNIFELLVNRESFDLYICPKCGMVEFYTPQNEPGYKPI
jgi:predicted nucleic-acid-binding Zn-ribbon protein